MIYTVTFNPSLDYIISIDDFKMQRTNRTRTEQILPGGKGINVSSMLWNLGIPSVALGFVAGFTGREIQRLIHEIGFGSRFIEVEKGNSRINIKMKNFEGTEINGKGPEITSMDLERLFVELENLEKDDILILAGSIPHTVPGDSYCEILRRAKEKGIQFVVDAEDELLLSALEYHPFLIKPNHYELGDAFGVQLQTREDVIPYAKKLQDQGARNVLVSLAGGGAVLVTETQEVHQIEAPQGKVVNAVGAGDAMVAGFLAEWLKSRDYLKAFRMSVATASASAFSENFAKKEEIEFVLENLL